MIGDRTLLASSTGDLSAITLSEPASNFEWIAFHGPKGGPAFTRIPGSSYSQSLQRIPYLGYSNMNGYVPFILQFSSTDRQNLSSKCFQVVHTNRGSSMNLYGSSLNTEGNIKFFKGYIYGEGRISGGSGFPIGKGSPGSDFVKYDETLLYSASDTTTADIVLSEPASAFRRLKVVVGSTGESRNVNEIPAPSVTGQVSVVTSIWGNNATTNYYCFASYTWPNMTTMHPYWGRAFQLGWNSASSMPTGHCSGGNTTSNGYINRPIVQVYGINRI